MRPVRTVAETRAAEAASGVAENVLIDRASTAVAVRAASMLGRVYGARVLVAAGPGHNGADALWAAWKLTQRGAVVSVSLPLGEPKDEHGAEPLRRLLAAGARRDGGGEYDLRLDGVLGIGARSGDRDWRLAGHGPVLAVDIPTGLDADTGAGAETAVRADATVTFGALKPALLLAPQCAGLVEVADIGLGSADASVLVVDAADARRPRPPFSSDKYQRGVVGIVAGSEQYPGAAALACRGAQRAGCGYVRLRAPQAVADVVRAAYPEVVAADGRADVWVVGPGLGTDDTALDLLREVLATDRPVVADADALTLLAKHRDLLDRAAPTILTPHTGEFERLTGVTRENAAADRIGVTRRAAQELGATVLLKGSTTVVSAGGLALLNPSGTPWLATAGTGDVLAGAIGAYLLDGRPPEQAAAGAAWLHGMAARLAAGESPAAITALDVAERLPDAARIASMA